MGSAVRAALAAALIVAGALPAWGQSFDELLKAVNAGDVKTVADFLDKGLDPNTTDREGHTLLMTASRLGHLDLVKLLIARKASVTRRSAQGDTALMFASLKGKPSLVMFVTPTCPHCLATLPRGAEACASRHPSPAPDCGH